MALQNLEFNLRLPRDRFHLKVNEKLRSDQIWAIMGASGCGKTSLLRSLAGLESHAKGTVSFNGETWQDSAKGIFVPPEKRQIGYIFQEPRLFPHLNVLENLMFARKRANNKTTAPSLTDVIEQVGIESLLERRIGKLSGGEKQRVAIARTLLNAPRLLLMDEPLASLDWNSKTSILPVLRDIHQHFNIPVVMVSHAREEVARLADQLLLMETGSVIAKGTCSGLMNRTGSPLANDDRALSILEARIIKHDSKYPMTELQLEGQNLLANRINAEEGEWVRLVLPADEVSIVLDDVSNTSIQNRLPVQIDGVTELCSHHMLISLAVNKQNLQALITHRSYNALGLGKGQKVYAHFKAACLNVL